VSDAALAAVLRSIDSRLARIEERVGLTRKLDPDDVNLLEQLLPAIVGALGDGEFLTADLYDEIGPRVVLRDCGRSRRSVGKLLARAADKQVSIDGFVVVRVVKGPPPRWKVIPERLASFSGF